MRPIRQIKSEQQRASYFCHNLIRQLTEPSFQPNHWYRRNALHIGYGNCIEEPKLRNCHLVATLPVLGRERNVNYQSTRWIGIVARKDNHWPCLRRQTEIRQPALTGA